MKKPSSKAREEIATLLDQLRAAETREAGPAKEMLTGVVRAAFREVIMDTVKSRLLSALADRQEVIEKIDEPSAADEPEVVTTEEEREGYMIVKAIVRDTISPKRVVMRDQKSYCGILIDNNNRRPLARLWFSQRRELATWTELKFHRRP